MSGDAVSPISPRTSTPKISVYYGRGYTKRPPRSTTEPQEVLPSLGTQSGECVDGELFLIFDIKYRNAGQYPPCPVSEFDSQANVHPQRCSAASPWSRGRRWKGAQFSGTCTNTR